LNLQKLKELLRIQKFKVKKKPTIIFS